jgi:pyruvate/2-oxoglutarate dehydrogenase complex dihydrolipoamide acyltransferase (E2) component
VSEDRAQQNTDAEEAAVRRGRDELLGAPARDRERIASEEPDVFLEVPELEVDRISLEVDNLRAHVSVLAELANLVSLSVGADVQLGRVKLEIEGVEARALLKVRLEHVRAILEKALDTIGEHPEILRIVSRRLNEVLRESLDQARAALEEVLEGLEVGHTVDEVLKGRLEDIRADLEAASERQGGEGRTRGALDEGPRPVRRVMDETGTIIEQTLDESGEVSAEAVVKEAEGTQNAVQATPAAKREAEELGVDLSMVEGTGAGGRITVRDVQKAAREEE